MSQNITLELRQIEAQHVAANGDYENRLAAEIVLNDGDVFTLKSCMLDTVSESSAIILEDDITIITASMPFFNDCQNFSTNIYRNQFVDGESSDYVKTCLDYTPLKRVDAGTVTGIVYANGWNYSITPVKTQQKVQRSYTTTYRYINEAGVVCYAHGIIREVAITGKTLNLVDTFSSVLGQTTSFSVQTTTIPPSWNVVWAPTPNTEPLTSVIYKPYAIPNYFVIPRGTYSPNEIAQLLSEKFATNNSDSAVSMIQSPYLWSAESFQVGYNQPDGSRNPDGTPEKITESVIFCDPALNYAITFTDGVKQWIGTNQLSVQFDSDAQRFSFVFTHFPFYSSDGKDIAMKFCRFNNDLTKPIQQITHYGGVLFTTLTATDTNGNVYDFWEGKLGIDVGSMMTNVTIQGPINTTRFEKTGTFFQYELVSGLTNTTGYTGIDAAVIKSVGSTGNWWEEVSLSVGTDELQATINTTIPIRGNLTLPQLLNTFSHYILQCDLYFSKVISSVDNYKNLHGIITKYYTAGGYCFGDNGGALEYIHRGAPVVIRSIKTRVLRPDKSLDPLLGPDNAVYFQVISNTPSLVKSIN